MKRLVPVTLAGALLLTLTNTAVAYTILDAADLNGNGVADSWTLDDNGDGQVDRLIADGDEDGSCEVEMRVDVNRRIASLWVDTDLDGYYDVVLEPYYADGGRGAHVANMVWRDADRNNRWENAYYDGQLDGYAEWVMVDTDFDGIADTWRANAAPPGRTALDEVSRTVANVGAINTLHAAGIPVFFPVSTIPLGG